MLPLDAQSVVRRIREAAAARAEATSIRQVSREVGMSPRGLHRFLEGAEPYSATRRKLERWFVYYAAEAAVEDADTAAVALRVLVQGLPPRRQPDGIARLATALAQAYAAADLPSPAWLARKQDLPTEG